MEEGQCWTVLTEGERDFRERNNVRLLGNKISHDTQCRYHYMYNNKEFKGLKLRMGKIYLIFKESSGRTGRGKNKIWEIMWKLIAMVKRQILAGIRGGLNSDGKGRNIYRWFWRCDLIEYVNWSCSAHLCPNITVP